MCVFFLKLNIIIPIFLLYIFSDAVLSSFKFIPPQRYFNKSIEQSKKGIKLPTNYQCSANDQCAPGLSCNIDYPNDINFPFSIQKGYCSCYRSQKGVNFLKENESTLVPSSISNVNSSFLYNRYGCATRPAYSYDRNFMPFFDNEYNTSPTYTLNTLYFNTGASWRHLLMTKPYPDMYLKFISNNYKKNQNNFFQKKSFVYDQMSNYQRYLLNYLPGLDFDFTIKDSSSKVTDIIEVDYSCIDDNYLQVKGNIIHCGSFNSCSNNSEDNLLKSINIGANCNCNYSAFNNEFTYFQKTNNKYSYRVACEPITLINNGKKNSYTTSLVGVKSGDSDYTYLCDGNQGDDANNECEFKTKEPLFSIGISCKVTDAISNNIKKLYKRNCDVYREMYLSRVNSYIKNSNKFNSEELTFNQRLYQNNIPALSILNKKYSNITHSLNNKSDVIDTDYLNFIKNKIIDNESIFYRDCIYNTTYTLKECSYFNNYLTIMDYVIKLFTPHSSDNTIKPFSSTIRYFYNLINQITTIPEIFEAKSGVMNLVSPVTNTLLDNFLTMRLIKINRMKSTWSNWLEFCKTNNKIITNENNINIPVTNPYLFSNIYKCSPEDCDTASEINGCGTYLTDGSSNSCSANNKCNKVDGDLKICVPNNKDIQLYGIELSYPRIISPTRESNKIEIVMKNCIALIPPVDYSLQDVNKFLMKKNSVEKDKLDTCSKFDDRSCSNIYNQCSNNGYCTRKTAINMLNLLPKYNFYETDYIVSKWPIALKAFNQYIEQCNIEASLISKIRQCLRLGGANLIKCLPEISQDAEGIQCKIPENYMINTVSLKNFDTDILIINDFEKFNFDNKKFLQTMN